MPDLHPEVLALIEAGPQFVDLPGIPLPDGSKLNARRPETPQEFASRIALRQQELEREECEETANQANCDCQGSVPAAAIRRRGKP